MGRKRWSKKPVPPKKRGAGSDRYVRREFATVYRDPKTGILCKVGPDQGPEQRQQHQLGVITGKRWDLNDAGRGYYTTGSVAVGASVLDGLRAAGFLYTAAQAKLREADDRLYCPVDGLAAAAVAKRRFEAAEEFAALCRRAGVIRRVTAGYEFRTDRGSVSENPKALLARKRVTARASRLGSDRFNILLDVLCLDLVPTPRRLRAFLAALDAYAELVRLSGPQGI